jgi:glycine/D-amino acid oxidase-like deaminating enzyme
MDHDCIVIGGGLVGSAVAYGLSRQHQKVAILDGGDRSFRASRGNFGLVWVQGKGWGTDLCYQRDGGMHFCIDENEWEEREKMNSSMKCSIMQR